MPKLRYELISLMSRESVSSCADALARQIILFGHPQPDAEILDAINEIDGAKIAEWLLV